MCTQASCLKPQPPTLARRQWLRLLLGGTVTAWATSVKAQEPAGSLSSFFSKRIPAKPINDEALSSLGGSPPPMSATLPSAPASAAPPGNVAPPAHLYPSAPLSNVTPRPLAAQNGVSTTPLPDTMQAPLLQKQPLPTEAPAQERVFGAQPNNALPNLPAAPAPIPSAPTRYSPPPSPFPPFQIISVQGDVRINGSVARGRSPIAVGNELSTGSDGVAIYRWLDEIVKVYPNSIVTHGVKPSQWMQLKGRVTVSSKAAPEPRVLFTEQVMVQIDACSFHVDSSLLTYSINGEAVETAYVCMCFGQGNLARTQNPNDRLAINAYHHNFPHFVAPRQFQPTAEVLGHNDAEIILLQSILQQIG